MVNGQFLYVKPRKQRNHKYAQKISCYGYYYFIHLFFFLWSAFRFYGGRNRTGKIFPKLENLITKQSSQNQSGQKVSVPDEESAVTKAVEKASPAVVSIIISKDVPKIQDFF